jgi:hypothetical protein
MLKNGLCSVSLFHLYIGILYLLLITLFVCVCRRFRLNIPTNGLLYDMNKKGHTNLGCSKNIRFHAKKFDAEHSDMILVKT